MALTKLSRQISEAAGTPTIGSPAVSAASVAGRKGWVPGIPIGGSTDNNPGQSTVAGALTRQNWMSQLFQSYLACTWVSDCVDVIARTITAGGVQCVPNNLSLEGATMPDPPAQVKAVQALLEYVNEEEDMRQLMREIVIDLLVFGDSFTEVVYLNKAPIALFPLDPQTMDTLADEHGTVYGYHQRMETGREAWFEPHQVIHVKMDAPGGGLYGVSDVQKNYVPITNYLFTEGLIQETMKRGDPARLHVDWPIALPINVQSRLAQAYQFKNLGAKNIGNLFETKGQTLVQELGTNKLKDWDMVATACRDEIISGFGVPPSKVGVIESANIGGGQGTSQDRSFRVNTCGPISELILEKFSFRLLYLSYGVKDWHLKFGEVDWRDDMTIEQIRDIRIRNGLWTVNRGRTDIGEPPIEGGDIAVLVDRQNLVAWRDMSDLSSANLSAILAASAASSAKGVGAAPNPTTPKPPKSTEADDGPYAPFDHLAYRDAYERYNENRQQRIMEELGRRNAV
jgi:hypothetical protein